MDAIGIAGVHVLHVSRVLQANTLQVVVHVAVAHAQFAVDAQPVITDRVDVQGRQIRYAALVNHA